MDGNKEFRDWIDKHYPSMSSLTNEEIAESVIFPIELTQKEKEENDLALKMARERYRNMPQ